MSKKSESTSRGDSLDATMTSLKVAVRVRPLNDKEINLGSKIVVDVLGNDIVITDLKVPEHQGYDHRSRIHEFSFDYGFSSADPASEHYASQATVFENFGRVVLQALLEGYNCCVIAYGQSGSGKTHTMMGMKDEEGLTPRICEGLLMKLEDKAKQNVSFAVNISYLEIYNEQVYDLLQKPNERTNYSKPKLRVREHPVHGPFVEGLSTHVLKSRDNVCQLISEGNDNRVKAATYIHERSSRSHAIFTVHCSQACLDESQPKEVVSKLQLVDLAGSEKAGHEFCPSRLQEGANINKSLVTLGNVISALVEISQRLQYGTSKGNRQVFVPYRDSQLTWLMKDSLGGNSHTYMLAAISPSKECYSETLSTLRYAQRAKSVLTVPVVNEDPATKIIRNLRSEVNKLKSLLLNADVLSKKALMKPLSNAAHLNSIMKKSEKQVDHLTRCWLEKWFETYHAVVKKANYLNEEASNVRKGSIDILHGQKHVIPRMTAEGIDTILCDSNIKCSIGTTPINSLSLKTGDSDNVLSDKSSSVSSECIILPNEIIFYSKGKRSHKDQNSKSNFEDTSLNHVRHTNKIITSTKECNKSFSNPIFQILCNPAIDISLYNSSLKSLPELNYSPTSTAVHNSFFIRDPLLRFLSLPEDIQTLPESFEVETEKLDVDSRICDKDIEETCEEKQTCRSDELMVPDVNHCEDHNIHGGSTEVKSNINNECFEQKTTSEACKDHIKVFDHFAPIQNHEKSLCLCKESCDTHCTDACNTADNFVNYEVITNDNEHCCEHIQFNDAVAEESDNFVKLLNRMQEGSVETINHGFQRKDSDILSLLSLSSNDYPPFYSLDDILDYDDTEAPDEADSVDTDALLQRKGQYVRESSGVLCSSPDVTDESESSDAESEFDYVDFTKSPAEKCSMIRTCHDFSAPTAPNGYQNFQESKFLRQANGYKENLVSIPESKNVESHCKNKIAPLAGNDMNLQSRNPADNLEISHEYHFSSPSSVHKSSSEQKNTLNSFHGSNEVEDNAKILYSKRKDFTSHLLKNSMFQKRLCHSDSILKVLPDNEVKCFSKSDNTVYGTEECSIFQNFSESDVKNENKSFYKNDMNNHSHEKALVTNKDSISDFLGCSVQDILDMFGDKDVAEQCAALKKQICPDTEEKFLYNNPALEEIQKFIDSTEITDPSKLANELLTKQISKYPTALMCTPTNNNSVQNNHKELPSKSEFYSSCLDTSTESQKYSSDKETKQHGLEAVLSELDNTVRQPPNDHEQKLPDIKQSNKVTTNAHLTENNVTHIINNVSVTGETRLDEPNYPKDNRNFNLHTAVQEVYCEKENALEYFTCGESQEFSLNPLLDENDCFNATGDLIGQTEKTSKLQSFNDGNCNRSAVKESKLPEYSAEHNFALPDSHSYSFTTESPNDSMTSFNSQICNAFADYDTFGNLNVTSLTPIQEEAVDDDVASDVSEDDSPNVSFQYDSLERPKNTPLAEKEFAYSESLGRTDATAGNAQNTKNVDETEKLNIALNDVSKSSYSRNSEISTKTNMEKQEDQNVGLSNSNFNHMKCIKMSNESMNSKTTIKFSSALGTEGDVVNAADTLCEPTKSFQFQDSVKGVPLQMENEHSQRCTVTNGKINQDDESFKSNADTKVRNFEETNNNLSNKLYSWDSSSSTTSSDSITFVFVGKENKDVTLDTNSRSFQSSLFSSVSLDSLERSSVHQNQASCISPRTLSIDSLVAEELLFQLRNSDPVHTLAHETKQRASAKCEMNEVFSVDQKTELKKTNFADTPQFNSNQHLKMYQHAQYNMQNNVHFPQDIIPEIVETEKCIDRNINNVVHKDQRTPFKETNFPSESCFKNTGHNYLQNLSENYSCETTDPEKHTVNKNLHYDISDDCIKRNHTEVHSVISGQAHILKNKNVLDICENNTATVPNYNCTDFGSNYSLDLQSNDSSVALNDDRIIASNRSSEHLLMNNYSDVQKQAYSQENSCSKENSFHDKFVISDYHNELFSIKELTEENLKIFNSEFEENRGEVFIVPPPSTFDVSENNGLSMISNSGSFSLVHPLSKTTADVSTKSTQTDQNTQNEDDVLGENDAINDSKNKDLLMCMMDLMVETLKLMKEQYSKTPKETVSKVRQKLHFSNVDVTGQKLMTMTPPDSKRHSCCMKKERGTDMTVTNCIQPVRPVNESVYLTRNSNTPLSHRELLPFPQETDNKSHLNVKSKVNCHHPEDICSTVKKPNFHTLPFDFITSKYQSKKLPKNSKFRKDGIINQTSVDCLADRGKNENFVSNKFNNLSAINPVGTKERNLSASSKTSPLQPSYPKVSNSKHLKHLIEVRRKIVETTMGSLKDTQKVSHENYVTDPLKSPSSSSEGYLSSVSSRGPLRQLSEVSTDSQESSHAAENLFSRQCLPKHNVRPLDFSSQYRNDVAISPDTRWLNTSADSGAFFLDSPGTEKKANLDECPNTPPKSNDPTGTVSSGTCTSSKMLEMEGLIFRDCDNLKATTSPKKENASLPSRSKPWNETKLSSRHHRRNKFTPGFQDLDEIGENYLDFSLKKPVSVNSSTSSDLSLGASRPSRSKNASKTSRSSPRLKRLSSQEIQKLLESIESDRRLLRQIQCDHVFDKKYSPSFILPSSSSLEDIGDLFYQDCYKSLPSPRAYLSPTSQG